MCEAQRWECDDMSAEGVGEMTFLEGCIKACEYTRNTFGLGPLVSKKLAEVEYSKAHCQNHTSFQ